MLSKEKDMKKSLINYKNNLNHKSNVIIINSQKWLIKFEPRREEETIYKEKISNFQE